MARYALCGRGLFLGTVTIHTPAHRHGHGLLYPRHFGHIAVTGFTLHIFGDVACVIKVHKVREVVHLDPLERLAFFKEFAQFLDVGFVGRDHRVAIHTDVHAGNRGLARLVDLRMAILAGDFVLRHMA